MTALLPWFALVVTLLAGWAIIKRMSTSMVLLFAGLAMIGFAVVCGVTGFLPKGVKPSGFVLFDIFDLLRSIATKQVSGIGFLIMVAGGYAAYMDRIGAPVLWLRSASNRLTRCPLRTSFWLWVTSSASVWLP